jgi:hypothetical protein
MLNKIIRKIQSSADSAVDTISSDLKSGLYGKYAEAQRGKKNAIYRYPDAATTTDQPFLLFSKHKPMYDHKVVSTNLDGHISIYIPMGINIADSFSYDNVETGFVGSTIGAIKGDDALGEFFTQETLQGLAAKYGTQAATVASAAVGNKFGGTTGAILSGAGVNQLAEASIREWQKSSQNVLNPRQFMLFKSPNLRTFTMDFNFIPNSEKESAEVLNIIHCFREGAYPSSADRGVTYNFPSAWTLQFMNVEGMVSIPQVVITSISTTYNPNSMSYFTQGPNNVPMEIKLSLSFAELQPLDSADVKKGL